jgi:MFS family permease
MSNYIKELYSYRSVPELTVSRFLFAFAQAMISTVWAILFFESGLSNSDISLIKVVVAFSVIATSLLLPKYLRRLDESRMYPLSLLISGLLLIATSTFSNLVLVTVAFLLMQVLYVVRQSTFSILFRDSFTRFKIYTLAQGMLGSMICTAWFIGPILSGFMMQDLGPKKVLFFAGLIFIISGLVASYKSVSHATKRSSPKIRLVENIRYFSRLEGMRAAYLIKSGVDAWWTLCLTFVPLLMVESGYSLSEIGIFVGLSQLPLVFGEFMAVKNVNKETFKRVFVWSYLVLAIAMGLSLLVNFSNFVIAIIILCSIPMAFLEPISEIYFYHITRKDEEELAYPIYMTASTFGEGFLSFLILPVAGLLGLKFSFLAVALYMLGLSLVSSRLKR